MTIEEAKDILGKEAEGMSDEEISTLTQLVDFSLDVFEKNTFGKTINELKYVDYEY